MTINEIGKEIEYLLFEYKETGDNSRVDNVLEAVEKLTTQVEQEAREEMTKTMVNTCKPFFDAGYEAGIKSLNKEG